MNKTGTTFRRPRAALRALMLGALLAGPLAASAAPVTGVYGSFGGFWASDTSTAATSTRPNDSNLLLAFTVGGTTYSTGVNDAALTANNVSFDPQVFRALPVSDAPPPYSAGTYIGIAQHWGGVEQTDTVGEVPTNPGRPLSYYLTDGEQGLELGTAIFNLPIGTVLHVPIEGGEIQDAHVSDGIPDILVTQMGDPGSTPDRYQFFDADGQPVGDEVSISFNVGVPVVGNQDWTFYQAGPPPSYAASLNNPNRRRDRAMRLVALHFSDFGIAPGDLASIRELRQTMSGTADAAFFAYNADSVPVALPQLTLGKTVAPSPLVQGATGSYTLTVQNTSDRVETDGSITLTDTLPTGLTPTAASGTDWTCNIVGQVVNCSYSGVLATGASAPEVTIEVAVAADAPASVTNTASVSGGGDADCPGADRCQGSATTDLAAAPGPGAGGNVTAVPVMGLPGLLLLGAGLGLLGWRQRRRG